MAVSRARGLPHSVSKLISQWVDVPGLSSSQGNSATRLGKLGRPIGRGGSLAIHPAVFLEAGPGLGSLTFPEATPCHIADRLLKVDSSGGFKPPRWVAGRYP